jgi:hypothetical protein
MYNKLYSNDFTYNELLIGFNKFKSYNSEKREVAFSTSDVINSNNVFFNLNDLYDRKSSDRVFYTVPGGSVPNDQDAFAKWCYNLPATCQEGNGLACIKKYHEDLRYRTSYR